MLLFIPLDPEDAVEELNILEERGDEDNELLPAGKFECVGTLDDVIRFIPGEYPTAPVVNGDTDIGTPANNDKADAMLILFGEADAKRLRILVDGFESMDACDPGQESEEMADDEMGENNTALEESPLEDEGVEDNSSLTEGAGGGKELEVLIASNNWADDVAAGGGRSYEPWKAKGGFPGCLARIPGR